MAEFFEDLKGQLQPVGNLFLLNLRRSEDIDHDILARGLHPRSEIRTLKKGTDNPLSVPKDDFIFFAMDHLSRNPLKGLPLVSEVELPFALETIQILNGHQNSVVHLSDDMGVDIEVDDRKSHFNGPLEMTGKGAGISPFFEKSIVVIDPLLNLSKVSSPPHLTKELSFEKLE
jgi:hypothetical protein